MRHLIVPGVPAQQERDPRPAEHESTKRYGTPWAELLRRVFDLDVLRCERCGGKRRLIALIRDPFVARKILGHLGLPTQPPELAPASAPPQGGFAL